MKPPEFLRVLPADVNRVGVLGACILASVRYMTTLTGQSDGRRIVEDQTWWRASHDDIAAVMGGGMSRRTVTRKVGDLIESGDLAAIPAQEFFGDRAQAYRVVDQPLDKTDTDSDQPSAILADRIGQYGQAAGPYCPTSLANMADVLSFKELIEVKDMAHSASPDSDDVQPTDVDQVGDDAPTAKSRPQKPNGYTAEFEEWWRHYPLKKSKAPAFKAWVNALKNKHADDKDDPVTQERLIEGAKRYAVEVAGRRPHLIKHPSGWLNDRRWTDESVGTTSVEGIQW